MWASRDRLGLIAGGLAGLVVLALVAGELWAVGGIKDRIRDIKEEVEERDPVKEVEEMDEQKREAEDEEQASEAEPEEPVKLLAARGNRFAIELVRELREREGNLFVSPHSLHTALTMTYAGARGQTAEQMESALSLPEKLIESGKLHVTAKALSDALASKRSGSDQPYTFYVANALWPQQGFAMEREFVALLRRDYGATLNVVDYQRSTELARRRINQWVLVQTRRHIDNLVPEGALDSSTRLVLTNAIYFKGRWQHTFPKPATKQAPFTNASGKQVNVPLMQIEKAFRYVETEHAQVVELPYTGDEIGFVVILPKQPADEKVSGPHEYLSWYLEHQLTRKGMVSLLKQVDDVERREVSVHLPRMAIASSFSLKEVLAKMGMADAFTDAADFSGIADQPLALSAVLHKAHLQVTEEGTEAAAASAIGIKATSEPLDPIPQVRCDRPFLVMIRHRESGAILFVGRVNDPTAE